jgi:hypothetical protein
MISVAREGDGLLVQSPYWRVRHDLRQGGLPAEMRVFHGTDANLLTRAAGARVDGWSEEFEARPKLATRRSGGVTVVEFSGALCARGGARSGIRFTHRYLYTDYRIRNELVLRGAGGIRARTLTACTLSLSRCFNEYVWGSTDWAKNKCLGWDTFGPQCTDIRDRMDNGFVRQEARRPWQISAFNRGIEGVSWIGDSHQYRWDGGRFQGRGAYSLAKTYEAVEIEASPVKQERALDCGREVALNWYIMLPNRRATCRPKYAEVQVQSVPFPDDKLLRAWADSGVNLLRFHDDCDYEGRSDLYWHDGQFPPYSPDKMKALQRFLKVCHALDMQVVPYFSPEMLAPDVPVFARHGREWYSMAFPNGEVRYLPSPRAGVYGAMMCLDADPCRKWYIRHIKQVVDACGFDGCYFDYNVPLWCHHPGHLPGEHNGVDGIVALLEDIRRGLGDRILHVHGCGYQCWLLYHNIADRVITLEEGQRRIGAMGLHEYPSSIEYMGTAEMGIVANPFEDESVPRGGVQKRGIAQIVHLNATPTVHAYSGNHGHNNCGYPDWGSFIRDEDAAFGLFRKFARIDFTRYRFVSYRSGLARIEGDRSDVLCSAYVGPDILAVVSNQTNKRVPGGTIRVRDLGRGTAARGRFGALRPYEVAIVPLKA